MCNLLRYDQSVYLLRQKIYLKFNFTHFIQISLNQHGDHCAHRQFVGMVFSSRVQGDTKKTVITKNRITSKMLFRLTQNFSYIRSSLCSRHLQSFKSVLQKPFVSLVLNKCAPNELPSAAGTFGSGGQSSL